eukprot:778752-Pelagomonas_calceolata.AAC.2
MAAKEEESAMQGSTRRSLERITRPFKAPLSGLRSTRIMSGRWTSKLEWEYNGALHHTCARDIKVEREFLILSDLFPEIGRS